MIESTFYSVPLWKFLIRVQGEDEDDDFEENEEMDWFEETEE